MLIVPILLKILTPFTNFLEILAIMFIPSSAVYSYGLMIGSKKHGWLLFFQAMLLFWVGGV